jgi:hypothetical protein
LSLWYKSIREQDLCFKNIGEAEKQVGEMTKKNGEFLPHHTTLKLFLGFYFNGRMEPNMIDFVELAWLG